MRVSVDAAPYRDSLLYTWRRWPDLTAIDLAYFAGISDRTVLDLLNGKRSRIQRRTAFALEKLFEALA